MYRLPSTLSLAFVFSVNAFAVTEETRPESARLNISSTVDNKDAENPLLEFAFLEETLPASQALAPKPHVGLGAGMGVIDFDQVFMQIPDIKPYSGVLAPASHEESAQPSNSPLLPVAVARIPVGPASDVSRSNPAALRPVPQIPVPQNPISQIPVPAKNHPVPMPAVESSLAAEQTPMPARRVDDQPAGEASVAEREAAPTVERGIQMTAAIEEIQDFTLEEVVVMNSDEAAPQTDAVAVTNVQPEAICESCNSTTQCQCQSKKSKWSCITDWWHSTSLYRHHVHGVGQPGLFCERPFGVCNEGFEAAMIVAGKADRAMLHHYDFVHYADGGIELTKRGHRELGRIVTAMAQFPVALSIETTFNPAEDAARRHAVLTAIAQSGLPVSPDSVLISEDRSVGLSGVDAQAIQAIRINEVLTGASRTRIYADSPGASVIPYTTGDGSPQQ